LAVDAIMKVLEAAGWSPNSLAEVLEGFEFFEVEVNLIGGMAPPDINNMARQSLISDIENLMVDYIADDQYQGSPKEFRKKMKIFHKALKALVAEFPTVGDELSEALNCELDTLTDDDLAMVLNCRRDELDHDDAPDVDHIRGGVRALLMAAERVLADEAGSGTDADRAKHMFIKGLGCIFEERTGQRPTRHSGLKETKEDVVFVPDGHFFQFVQAVNEQLPTKNRLVDIDSLIKSYIKHCQAGVSPTG
jgi:hypothetical protein